MKLFCPKCGEQATVPTETGNGGQLYVAEDMGGATEHYDSAYMHKCEKCPILFYTGDSVGQG